MSTQVDSHGTERIMQVGKKKLVLDHLIVQTMDNEDESGDIKSMITYGAEALFGEGRSKDIVYSDADIEELIDKTEQEPPSQPEESASAQTFSFAKIWTADHSLEEFGGEDTGQKEADDAWTQTWQRIIETNQTQQQQQQEATGRGARRRTVKAVQYLPGIDDSPEKHTERKGQKHRRAGYDSDGSVFGSDIQSGYSSSDVGSTRASQPDVLPPESNNSIPTINVQESSSSTANQPVFLEPVKSKKSQKLPKSRSRYTKTIDSEYCGLCRRWHGDKLGDCPMTQKSEYLAEYRQMLMLHADDESDELRVCLSILFDGTHSHITDRCEQSMLWKSCSSNAGTSIFWMVNLCILYLAQ
jgi:chromodomain-helicase-DNA-binding protein 4